MNGGADGVGVVELGREEARRMLRPLETCY